MQSRPTVGLVVMAVILGFGEFANAVMIKVENYPDAQPIFAIVFGLLFLLGAWLVSRARIVAGAALIGLLCLVEVIGFPGWTRHRSIDWAVQIGYASLSLVGLALAVAVLVSHRRQDEMSV